MIFPILFLSSRGHDNPRHYIAYMRVLIVSLLTQTVKSVQRWVSESTSPYPNSTSTNTGHGCRICCRQPSRRSLLTCDLLAASLRYAGTSRYEFTNNHVLFETDQVICAGLNSGLCQHTGRFLKGCRGQETIGVKRGFGDAQEHSLCSSRLSAFRQYASIGIRIDKTVYEIIWQHFCIPRFLHFHAAQHLPNDNLDMFITDINTSVTIDTLHFFDHVHLHGLSSLDTQNILWIALTTSDRGARLNLLTIGHHNIARSRDGIRSLLAFLKANGQHTICIDVQLTLGTCHYWYWLAAIFSRHHSNDLIF